MWESSDDAPAKPSKLSSLFNKPKSDDVASLQYSRYTKPEPATARADAKLTTESILALSARVYLYRTEDPSNGQDLGEKGLAVIVTSFQNKWTGSSLLVYDLASKTAHCQIPLSGDDRIKVQPQSQGFAGFFDQSRNFWSIGFHSLSDMRDLMTQIALLCFGSTGGEMDIAVGAGSLIGDNCVTGKLKIFQLHDAPDGIPRVSKLSLLVDEASSSIPENLSTTSMVYGATRCIIRLSSDDFSHVSVPLEANLCIEITPTGIQQQKHIEAPSDPVSIVKKAPATLPDLWDDDSDAEQVTSNSESNDNVKDRMAKLGHAMFPSGSPSLPDVSEHNDEKPLSGILSQEECIVFQPAASQPLQPTSSIDAKLDLILSKLGESKSSSCVYRDISSEQIIQTFSSLATGNSSLRAELEASRLTNQDLSIQLEDIHREHASELQREKHLSTRASQNIDSQHVKILGLQSENQELSQRIRELEIELNEVTLREKSIPESKPDNTVELEELRMTVSKAEADTVVLTARIGDLESDLLSKEEIINQLKLDVESEADKSTRDALKQVYSLMKSELAELEHDEVSRKHVLNITKSVLQNLL